VDRIENRGRNRRKNARNIPVFGESRTIEERSFRLDTSGCAVKITAEARASATQNIHVADGGSKPVAQFTPAAN